MSERDTRVEEIRARWTAHAVDRHTAEHAPEDIAWLLAEVERLTAEMNLAREEIEAQRRETVELRRVRDEARVAQACAEEAIDEWQEERASLWARVKTAEELCAAHVADISKAVTGDLAATTRERDEARAEVERLRAERDEAATAPDGLAAIFGTLFEFVLAYSGGTPSKRDPEEWLSECRIPANAVRDRLRSLAQEHPFEWREMDLHRDQMRWLGLKP